MHIVKRFITNVTHDFASNFVCSPAIDLYACAYKLARTSQLKQWMARWMAPQTTESETSLFRYLCC